MLARSAVGVVIIAALVALPYSGATATKAQASDTARVVAAIAAGALLYSIVHDSAPCRNPAFRRPYRPGPRVEYRYPHPYGYTYRERRAYREGYREGYRDGYVRGYRRGEARGYYYGYRDGYVDGRRDQAQIDWYYYGVPVPDPICW